MKNLKKAEKHLGPLQTAASAPPVILSEEVEGHPRAPATPPDSARYFQDANFGSPSAVWSEYVRAKLTQNPDFARSSGALATSLHAGPAFEERGASVSPHLAEPRLTVFHA